MASTSNSSAIEMGTRNTTNGNDQETGIPREYDSSKKDQLYEAALKGDWRTAESIKDSNREILSAVICDDREETALHIATRAMKASFVKKLVEYIPPHVVALKNKYGNTALCIAASSGAVNIAKFMVGRNTELPHTRGYGDATPVLIAARYKHKDMLSYLLSVTQATNLNENEAMDLLAGAIYADYYDIAFKILEWNPRLALDRDMNSDTALHIMARKSIGISSKNKPTMWHRCLFFQIPLPLLFYLFIYMLKINSSNIILFHLLGFKCLYKNTMMQIQARQVVELMWKQVIKERESEEILEFINYPTKMLEDAAKVGNVEFLKVLINSHPDLPWQIVEDENMRTIFHIAVENRQVGVFSLIYEMGDLLDYLPRYFNENKISLLELAAKKPAENHHNRVSGAAFQIHRELLLFKEVENIVKLTMTRKNGAKTMRELFSEEHKELMKQGEKWMKATGTSCTLVATLIATVVFAAAFTVPGGYNNNSGSPMFIHQNWFTVFVISDAIALISSSTSIVLFLSILTSHYEEEDFLYALPRRLVSGTATLFVSLISMLVAFSATFFVLYDNPRAGVPWIIAVMAFLPIFFFSILHYKLVKDAIGLIMITNFFSKTHKMSKQGAVKRHPRRQQQSTRQQQRSVEGLIQQSH